MTGVQTCALPISLDATYLNIISDFKRKLLEKNFEFQDRLISIPEYKNIHRKSQLSLSGNKKIDWKKQSNQLVDFYIKQLEGELIETDVENLKLFLLNNFTHNGQPLNKNSLNTYFDPNKKFEKLPKKHKQINPMDFLE